MHALITKAHGEATAATFGFVNTPTEEVATCTDTLRYASRVSCIKQRFHLPTSSDRCTNLVRTRRDGKLQLNFQSSVQSLLCQKKNQTVHVLVIAVGTRDNRHHLGKLAQSRGQVESEGTVDVRLQRVQFNFNYLAVLGTLSAFKLCPNASAVRDNMNVRYRYDCS